MIRKASILGCCCLLATAVQASVVVYTITSRTSVRADGIEPVGSYAQYEQSATGGRIGQMTEGNYTSLSLYGYSGQRIRSITLEMRSNASAGAGTLEMLLEDSCVWSIEAEHFASDKWNGAYSTAYVPIKHLFCPCLPVDKGEVLRINVDALVSSLYIRSYTIEYFDEWEAPFTVTFHSGTAVSVPAATEPMVGDGVRLPDCAAADSEWHFVGWTETAIEQTEVVPAYWRAGEMYYPQTDIRLYALYANGEKTEAGLVQDTLFETGSYIMADAIWQCMATGGLNKDKKLPATPLALHTQNAESLYVLPEMELSSACIYNIDFLPDSLALIRNVETGDYIAPPSSNVLTLQNTGKAWRWYRQADNSVKFQSSYTGQTRELRAMCGTTLATVDSIWFANNLLTSSETGNLLFRIDLTEERPTVSYTSFPLGGTALQNPAIATWRQAGNCIINPSQMLLRLYTINGQQVRCSREDMDLSTLPHGVYLLRAEGQCSKIVVR